MLMSQKRVSLAVRQEFVLLANQAQIEMRTLCTRYGISTKTGYQWLKRFRTGGLEALAERDHRPHRSPRQTAATLEQVIVAVRDDHPAWGGRKIRAYLLAQGQTALPSPSTMTAILRRHQRLSVAEGRKHQPWHRFEQVAPNRLWQMDFKGHFAIAQGRCHPLTVLDDHSRFVVCLQACGDEQGATVQAALTATFRRYGLPERMLMDNGPPWGTEGQQTLSALVLWLIRLGIRISHSHPYHPQTQGKDERFHRTLKAEVLRDQYFASLSACQQSFDRWREVYNRERPHQALDMAVPISRYQPSPCSFPETLPPIEYGPDDLVRKVQNKGQVHFQGRLFTVSSALQGYPVAFRPVNADGQFDIYFCHHKVTRIDLRTPA
jgi:transposase InsO family protein